MAWNRLNLARRPFVDTRPVHMTVAILSLAAVALTGASWRNVTAYYAQSARTREAISGLKRELETLDERRRTKETALARYDVAELAASARDANAIARLKAFSWTRFLSRLERTLPAEDRVSGIGLSRPDSRALEAGADAYGLSLVLISKDPEGLPKAVRAFYASPWFDHPVPIREDTPEKGKGLGWRLSINVTYLDRGKK
jgi:hypothetical protein